MIGLHIAAPSGNRAVEGKKTSTEISRENGLLSTFVLISKKEDGR
jgi:hypothetical protein